MERLHHLALIGAGGMSETVLVALAERLEAPLERLSLLVRPGREAAARQLLARHDGRLSRSTAVHTSVDALGAEQPELVVECAGHQAVRAYGAALLGAGSDLLVVSTGAFADDALLAEARAAAIRGGGRLFLSTGAVGGIDALRAAALSGLRSVVYAGRKPPLAWRGSPAEDRVDLAALQTATTFFEGSAREAALAFPQNANVAATVALAGAGLDGTRVELVADPGVTRNVHEIAVESDCASFTIRLEGKASAANPKTSLTAGYSLARLVLDRRSALVL